MTRFAAKTMTGLKTMLQEQDKRLAGRTTTPGEVFGKSGAERREEIADAIQRIEAGTYGECIECLGNIPLDRLKANPAAALCIECQREVEKLMAVGRNGHSSVPAQKKPKQRKGDSAYGSGNYWE